jgi:hypothetical protein
MAEVKKEAIKSFSKLLFIVLITLAAAGLVMTNIILWKIVGFSWMDSTLITTLEMVGFIGLILLATLVMAIGDLYYRREL